MKINGKKVFLAHLFCVLQLASAGYGEDDTAAINILKTMKAVDGFAIAIILKPFSFEGQRRLDEVVYASTPCHYMHPCHKRVKRIICSFFDKFILCVRFEIVVL